MTREADFFHMGLALELARRGLGRTSPNPAVGCVVVKEGRILGRGYHPAAGAPHAEIFALQEAGKAAVGADLFVTLEPCSHTGRTPPCADQVVRSGVRRVVVAERDPNPAVAGCGLQRLRAAGLRVEVGLRAAEAGRLNEAFALSIRERRSFVHLKLAATLDGKTATSTGDSHWISSPDSRRRVHELRARCGAVVAGVGTVLADDPQLTVRLPEEPPRFIPRYVLDPTLRCSPELRLFAGAGAAHTVVVAGPDAAPERADLLRRTGAEVLHLPVAEGRLDLGALLRETYARGRMEILVEGGSQTARAFLDAGLVDRLHLFLSPRILGGADAVPLFGGTSPDRISDALPLAGLELSRSGPDIYITGIPRRE